MIELAQYPQADTPRPGNCCNPAPGKLVPA